MPVKRFGEVFIGIAVIIVAEGRLLTAVHLHDPFHGRLCRVIGGIIRVGIVVIIIPIGLATDAEV